MKKIALLAFTMLLSTVVTAQNPFNLKGTAPAELNGKKAYLYIYDTGLRIDSSQIENNKFQFNVQLDKPAIGRIIFEGSRISDDIFVENIPVEVELNENGISAVKSTGGLNEKYAAITDHVSAFKARLPILVDSLKNIYTDDQQALYAAFSDIVTPMSDKIYDMIDNQMKANTDNVFGVYCIWKLSGERTSNVAQLDSLMALVPASKEFAPLEVKRQEFEVLEATSPGAMFKDFAAQTIDGKATKLSNFVGKGKYVLVDFWASWCGPCMREVPNLKYINETYPELVVLGVNVWDKHDKFLEAIEQKGMTWTSIYASDNTDATDLYGIKGIPTIILFAPDGKIVDRTLRGEEMKTYIANLFKK